MNKLLLLGKIMTTKTFPVGQHYGRQVDSYPGLTNRKGLNVERT